MHLTPRRLSFLLACLSLSAQLGCAAGDPPAPARDSGATGDGGAGSDGGRDSGPNFDAGPPVDSGARDAGLDSGRDAGSVPPMDSGPNFDAGPPFDAGRDAGRDARVDSGRDSGRDAGRDAGPPNCESMGGDCDDGLTCTYEYCSPSTPGAGADGCVRDLAYYCNDDCAATTEVCVEAGATDYCEVTSTTLTDADGDGFFASVGSCVGYIEADCVDSNPNIHPNDYYIAPYVNDICDGLDNDCSGGPDSSNSCVLGSAPRACMTYEYGYGVPGSGADFADYDACGVGGPLAGKQKPCDSSCNFGSCSRPEVCDGCDDDGDNMIDDGCSVSPNDTCANAIPLFGPDSIYAERDAEQMGYIRGSRLFSLQGSTAQMSGCGTGAEVFFVLEVGVRSLIYLDTYKMEDSDPDERNTAISYVGDTCATTATQCVNSGCARGGAHIVRLVEPGSHYFAVHRDGSSTLGTFPLRWQVIRAGDDTTELTSTGMFTGNTSGDSNRHGGCGPDGAGDSMYWFTVCPDASRSISADTCISPGFFSSLSFRYPYGYRTGDWSYQCASGDCAAGRGAQLNVNTDNTGLHAIIVDGSYSGSPTSGAYTLNVTSL